MKTFNLKNEVLVVQHRQLPLLTHPTVQRQQALPLEIRGSETFTKHTGSIKEDVI